MAITKLNSLAIPPDTVVESDISFPLDSASFTGDLTVDTDTLVVDATDNSVGIGMTPLSSVAPLQVTGGTYTLMGGGGSLWAKDGGSNNVKLVVGPNGLGSLDICTRTNVSGVGASDVERIALLNNGNVGIGSDDPRSKLTVAGTAPKITLESTDTQISNGEVLGSLAFYSNDASGSAAGEWARIDAIAEGEWDAATTKNGETSLAFYTTDNTSSPATAERMRISYDGNVGIGESNPSAKLEVNGDVHVTGSGGAKLLVENTAPKITLRDTSVVGAESDEFIIRSTAGQSSGDYEFVLNNDLTSSNDQVVMKFSGAGNVGIGLEDPRTVLEVSGSTNRPLTVNSSSSTSVVTFTDSATSSIAHVKAGSEGDDFVVYAGANERMRIGHDGDVGIGTTIPDSKLDVRGTIFGGASAPSLGQIAFGVHYGGSTNVANTYGTMKSSAATCIGWGVYGSPTTAEGFVSSVDTSLNFKRGALLVDQDELRFLNAGQQTVARDAAVTMTERFKVDVNGNVGINDNNPAAISSSATTLTIKGLVNTKAGALYLQSSDESLKSYIYQDSSNGMTIAAQSGSQTVRFIAGGSERARFTGDGLTFNGDTAAANALDDYEEGTWPVTLSDGTTTSGTLVTGRYTKIGQVVIARFDALNNINPTGFGGANNVRISLPFTAGSTGRSTGSVIVDGIDRGSRTQVNSKVSDNVAFANIVKSGSNLNDLAVNWSDINSASYVNDIVDFCIVYTV